METMKQHINNDSGWEAWEAAPRDGPAVFIVDAEAWDQGVIRGRWCDPYLPVEQITEQVEALLGRPTTDGSWAIVDQVGLGGRMMEEQSPLEALAHQADLTLRPEGEPV